MTLRFVKPRSLHEVMCDPKTNGRRRMCSRREVAG